MKKIALIAVVCAFMAAPTYADMFTFNKSAALLLTQVDQNATVEIPASTLYLVTTDPVAYNGTDGMYYQVGFTGLLQGQAGADAWMKIGAASGAQTAADVIGAALETSPTGDLSGFDGFQLNVANDNDDTTHVALYVTTAVDTYQTAWKSLPNDTQTQLTLDFTGIVGDDFSQVTDIGFLVKAVFDGQDGSPSDPDIFHVSIVPVPAAMLLGMLGLGTAGLRLRKRS